MNIKERSLIHSFKLSEHLLSSHSVLGFEGTRLSDIGQSLSLASFHAHDGEYQTL